MEAQMMTTSPVLVDRGMPSAALRLLFLSIEEVMGPDGIKAVLNGAKLSHYIGNYPENSIAYGVTFSEYGKVEQAVEDFLGPRGARAILIRVGRELFRYSLREQSALLGIAGNALKNMPLISTQAKMKILLQQIVSAANKTVNQPARLEENDEAFLVVIDKCMCQWRPRHDKPCCLVTVGTFSEAMKWLTEKPVEVKEITCLNNGADACRYQIPKRMPEE
jgi:predicted hydrocarbon binding protein